MPSEVIRSRANPLVKRLRALKQQGASDLLLIEGPKLLEEALAAGVAIVEAAASPRLLRHERGRELMAAVERGCPVRVLDDDLLASLSEVEASQGVLALARRPRFDEQRMLSGRPLILVAVGVQDPGNVGALLRTAEAAGAAGAYLTGDSADAFAWKALRGSMGSAFRLPHFRVRAPGTVIERLRASGLRLVGTGPGVSVDYTRADLSGPLALFLGSEGAGLPAAVQDALEARVSVPMAGGVESLNVAVAAGVLLFEAARQRRVGPWGSGGEAAKRR
jgi:RNA methyltransferase, TrmH family